MPERLSNSALRTLFFFACYQHRSVLHSAASHEIAYLAGLVLEVLLPILLSLVAARHLDTDISLFNDVTNHTSAM